MRLDDICAQLLLCVADLTITYIMARLLLHVIPAQANKPAARAGLVNKIKRDPAQSMLPRNNETPHHRAIDWLSPKQSSSVWSIERLCETNTVSESRRATLGLTVIAVASLCVGAGRATANEAVPKKYVDQARELIDLLRDPIESEADGAEESKVRKKADAAKAKIKPFISSWANNRLTTSEESYGKITEVLRELGQHYQQNGPRARLPADTRESVLSKLATAERLLDDQI